MSSDRGGSITGGGYEYDNSAALYAYDNPSANSDVGGSSSFGFSRYQCGGRNPTFVLDPVETSLSQYEQQTMTSLSLPYLRRAGDYSNYFSVEDNLHPVEVPIRPTTLEVCVVAYTIIVIHNILLVFLAT